MPRLLITLGIVLVVLGVAWPWLQKSGLGRLPGDFTVERGNFRLYFPLTTSLIVSLLLSLLYWFWRGK
jgi:ribose/xylose/arabinose/galactoside ABC-type transport system permease subunit